MDTHPNHFRKIKNFEKAPIKILMTLKKGRHKNCNDLIKSYCLVFILQPGVKVDLDFVALISYC